ncbi:hypothetical protein Tco_1495456 [Tanacetum coccineum]
MTANPTTPFVAILKTNAALGLRPNLTHPCGSILLNQPAPLFCCRGTTETNTLAWCCGLSNAPLWCFVTAKRTLFGFTRTKRTIGAEPDPNAPHSADNNHQTQPYVAVMVVLAAVGRQPKRRGREKAQVGASGVDRVTRKLFEAHRKTPPEKFSGGGEVVPCGGRGGRRWAAGKGRGERD